MILVTGAKGYIGSLLMQRLSQHMILATPFVGDASMFNHWAYNMEHYNPSTIVHLAAKTDLIDCENNPKTSYSNNYVSALWASHFAKMYNCRLIFTSTITDTQFDTVYESDKRSACLAIKSMRLSQYVILKLATVYGQSLLETKPNRGVINRWVSEGKGNRPIVVYSEVTNNHRDFVHVSDVVNRIIQGIDAKSGYYEVCTGKSKTMLEAAQYIANATGSYVDVRESPRPLFPVEKRDELIKSPRWINGDHFWISFEDGIEGLL